ncbi:unnamed protein product [Protopolystoma xenopodis]|uniref:TLC domain-containing protein n=1 Tax=Protopolystoma xenopodis TaxID=117903 RepID=A0A3S5AK82_9PLAT|nr:unnamed protein product [Protopolystoma xenopodis]
MNPYHVLPYTCLRWFFLTSGEKSNGLRTAISGFLFFSSFIFSRFLMNIPYYLSAHHMLYGSPAALNRLTSKVPNAITYWLIATITNDVLNLIWLPKVCFIGWKSFFALLHSQQLKSKKKDQVAECNCSHEKDIKTAYKIY